MKQQLEAAAPAPSRSDKPATCSPTMRLMLVQIIESMRDELKLHGETLALLERHEMLVMTRCFEGLLDSAIRIDRPIAAIRELRSRRASNRRELARRLGVDAAAKLAVLTPLLPGEYRILIEALIKENISLASRVKQCAVRIPWCPPAWKLDALMD